MGTLIFMEQPLIFPINDHLEEEMFTFKGIYLLTEYIFSTYIYSKDPHMSIS